MLRSGSQGVRFWLSSYLPVATLVALYFSFEALFGKMPLVSNYADLRNFLNLPQLWVLFVAAAFSISMISLYTVRAISMLRRHKRNLESNFSYTEGSTLGWMWWAIAIILIKWLIYMIRITVEGGITSIIGTAFFTLEPIIITVLVLRQKDLYSHPSSKDRDNKSLDDTADEAGVELSPDKRKTIRKDLLRLLKKNAVYKDPDLTGEKVCEMLGTNRTYLWLVINKDMNTTFYQLINTWRLNQSVEMMNDPHYRKMSLQSIAEICGFKSATVFGRLFKQKYGKTPKEWREEALPGGNEPE
jgi:AraC-like DNA-binding protein